MVVKRQCSFCADEIEPGTGSMYVKRDGTIYHYCSSSCRRQMLGLGRVGHRLKWTRAHALKRIADQRAAAAPGGVPKPGAAPAPATSGPAAATPTEEAKPGARKPAAAKPRAGSAQGKKVKTGAAPAAHPEAASTKSTAPKSEESDGPEETKSAVKAASKKPKGRPPKESGSPDKAGE